MVDLRKVERTIEELEEGCTSYANCEKLALLYIVRDHLKADGKTAAVPEAAAARTVSTAPNYEGWAFTPELAEEWTKKMHNEDGSKGEHWNINQVKALMSQKALTHNPFEIYAVMNAIYSDYSKVLKKRGITTPDAYLDMALAFINDPDAVENKAAAYYEYIVKH